MNDVIYRQDVLKELDGCDYELKDWQRWKLKTMVRDIPSAQPERKKGKWIELKCNQCGQVDMSKPNFCPNCGADIGKSQHRELWHYEQALAEIRELLEKEPHWIPCSERLPSKSDHKDNMVLVCYGNGSIRFNTYMNGWTIGNPIAWMPLPKPYGGESE